MCSDPIKKSKKATLNEKLNNINLVLQSIGLIAAGIWAIFYFNLMEFDSTETNFNGRVSLEYLVWSEKENGCIFDFIVVAENSGKNTQKIDHLEYFVCELEAPDTNSSDRFYEIKDTCKGDKKPVTMGTDYIYGQNGEIHPGEKKVTIYSFLAKEGDWPWRVEATAYGDSSKSKILFKGSDWKFCKKNKQGS